MTKIWSMPTTEVIDYRYSRLFLAFPFYSDVLGQLSIIPAGFVMDWESIWRIKGSGKIEGLIHDYLARKDSVPVVTKKIAADVYLEFLDFFGTNYWIRYGKYWTVLAATGYFHKHNVLSTYEELVK